MSARAPLWTSDEAARATGGKANRDWSAHGVSIDTRSIAPGDLFVALQGDSRDGHGFVAAALEKGAASALVSRVPDGVASGAPLLIVEDTQRGLEDLGRASRARSPAKIAAVTGSAGKTTTKEMLRLMLSNAGQVAASAASYNNHWGVPLSLARMTRDAAFGVFEIGMNHADEIRALNAFVRPHVALITTIAPAHLEYFGTVEAIADAKAEIFESVEPGGAAILPADNPQVDRLKAHAHAAGVKRILTFGTRDRADARLVSAQGEGEGQKILAELGGKRIAFSIGAAGAHIAMNAIAALLAARELGADVKAASAALAKFNALKGRGARFAAGGIEIIDESYNANPASMSAALGLLGQTRPKSQGRRIAVLGDMLELGADSARLHGALAKDIAAAPADLVFLCGPQMAALWQALPEHSRGAYAEKSTELAPELMRNLRAGDVVLVKGSFGSRMSVIIDALKSREAATA
ncbi:MAG TPA: UDP-N-acetylmuramoylalanyl-D-glutamyl-2,6-diaminopimelate--D-alanyl-D-alanine ligase [Micropepsaceae bacterium]|nr:UDP-N-acetylmuramoylalanyl-D-glutamyl-2,6-diaminopimelate--D-alanyl-D-alanine ligase [Micropepsaceae bacterium]